MAAVWGDSSHGIDREPQPPQTAVDAIDLCSKSWMIGVSCRRAPASGLTDQFAAHAAFGRHATLGTRHDERITSGEGNSQDGASRSKASRQLERPAGADRDGSRHGLRPDHRSVCSSARPTASRARV